jgi:hypothetical protein
MASKKIEFILDVDSKPIDVAVDSTLNLKQQYRELIKEINKTKEGTKEFELLSSKLGDVKDRMETTTAKSRDLFGSLSMLPGPVGMFAGSIDSAVGSLKLFSSFSFKDLKFQLGETVNDFKDIATNLGKATGITKIYTVLNGALANSFKAVGVAEGVAASGARALSAALTATGIGALVVAIGYLVGKIMEWASSTEEADNANERLNNTLKAQNDLIAKNAKDIDNFAKQDVLRAKIAGKTEEEIYRIQVQANKDLLANRRKANDDAFAELQKFNKKQGDYAKLTDEQRKEMSKTLIENEKKTYEAITDQITSNGTFELEYQNTQADKLRTKKKEQTDKQLAANKQYQEKVAQDNKSAGELLLDLQQENAVLALKNERDRQDKELKNQKQDEENKINSLLITQEKKNKLLEQVTIKYNGKQADLNKKRQEDDLKAEKEALAKLEDIRINAIANTQEKEKAELQKGYNDTKADLDKYLEDKKITQEQYNQAILNLNAALAAGIKKIDDDKEKEDQDKRLKKLDDELKFLQIKGEALMQGTKAFYENQRAILNAAEQRELADTTLTEEQKTIIKEKYVQARKKLAEQEFAANAQVVSQTLDAVAKLAGAIASSYDEEAKTSKEAFEKRKKLQVATALMSAASGVIQILTQPSTLPSPFDWIVKGINAAALAVTTGVQISNIKKTQFSGGGDSGGTSGASAANLGRNYEEGGLIGGRRHAQGGTMIEAEAGEAIMTRGAVTMFAPMLSMMNQMGGGTSFGNQLFIRPDAAAVERPQLAQEPVIMKTYVVSNDLTTEQEKLARLKDLSTL